MNFPKPAVGMLPNDRLAYSAIPKRKPLKLPKGARMVVWTITNVEEWDATQPMPRTVITPPAGGSPIPDIPNWCWHEYGNRVGFWRLLKVYDEFKIPGVMNINGSALVAYPDIVKAAVERQWEFVGHGFPQKNMQKVADERDDIRRTSAAIRTRSTRSPPADFLSRLEGTRPTSSIPRRFSPTTSPSSPSPNKIRNSSTRRTFPIRNCYRRSRRSLRKNK